MGVINERTGCRENHARLAQPKLHKKERGVPIENNTEKKGGRGGTGSSALKMGTLRTEDGTARRSK